MHHFWQSFQHEAVQGEHSLATPHSETQIENLTFQTGNRHFNSSISQKYRNSFVSFSPRMLTKDSWCSLNISRSNFNKDHVIFFSFNFPKKLTIGRRMLCYLGLGLLVWFVFFVWRGGCWCGVSLLVCLHKNNCKILHCNFIRFILNNCCPLHCRDMQSYNRRNIISHQLSRQLKRWGNIKKI